MEGTKKNISISCKTKSAKCGPELVKRELRSGTVRNRSSSKTKAVAFLKKTGICDDNGNLSVIYK